MMMRMFWKNMRRRLIRRGGEAGRIVEGRG
jgi:hypothetical protein